MKSNYKKKPYKKDGDLLRLKKGEEASLVPTPSDDRVIKEEVSLKGIKSKKKLNLENVGEVISEGKVSDVILISYLTPHLRLLSSIYKALCIIYAFNKERKLNFIFHKHRPSIERMVGHLVSLKNIRELVQIVPDSIEIKEIAYENKISIKIEITKKVDIEYEIKRRKVREEDLAEKSKESNPEIVGRKEVPGNKSKENPEVTKRATSTYEEILERVKSKEVERRKKFKEFQKLKFDFSKKIEEIFKVNGISAMRLRDLEFTIRKFKGEERIREVCDGSKFFIKKIEGEEYVVRIAEEE